MTSRPLYRLVPVVLVACSLVAAAPGLAAPAQVRPAAPLVFQVLHELWAELTGSFTSLFAATDDEEVTGGSNLPDTSPPLATDDPLVQPQLGKDDDPNG